MWAAKKVSAILLDHTHNATPCDAGWQGGTLTLSASLLVAFDTTVAGLVVGLVTYTITKVRQRWYDNYMSALEASCTSVRS